MKQSTADDAELPDGWVSAKLADVTVPVRNIDPQDLPSQEFRYVDISAISNSTFRITDPKRFLGSEAPSRARRPVQTNDVLFSNVRTYLRNIAIVTASDDADVCSTGFTVLRPSDAIVPEFLFRYTLTDEFINAVTPHQTGTHYPATSDRVVLSQGIPLPPLEEQRRIIAKVEPLLTRVQATSERIARVPIIIKKFREAVLAAACSGRLTLEWRGENAHETASALIKRLISVKTTRTAKKDEFPFEQWRSRKLTPPPMSELPELPEEWVWVRLPDTGYMNRGRSRNRPRNAPHLYGGPYPFVQTGDIARSRGRVTQHQQTYSEAGLAQSRLWPTETVCITIAANIADSALLTYPACFPDSVVGIVTDPELCLAEYLEYFIRTARENLSQFAPATAQKNINVAILDDVAVPLPPILEQREIVRRVDAVFKLVDAIEHSVSAATTRAEKSTQAILAKAFRGDLVPTEAELARLQGRTYESAAKLLERAKAKVNSPSKPKLAGKAKAMTTRSSNKSGERKPLRAVLEQAKKGLSSEELFEHSGFDDEAIEDFYRELREGIANGWIVEERPNKTDIVLKAV